MKEIVVIAGPTASGKSSLAIKLAKKINGYIINADSRQVYKGIAIATAQPKPDKILDDKEWIIDDVEHYLYGFVKLSHQYNIYQYQQDVFDILNNTDLQSKTPILVGGTGLYIDSVVNNYNLKPEINIINLSQFTLHQLQQKLIDLGIKLNESDFANRLRLERIISKGTNIAEKNEDLKHRYFVIDVDKEVLRQRIIKRVQEMIQNGLEYEAKELYERYHPSFPQSLNIIGFKEFIPYFLHQQTLKETEEDIVLHTQQYAKRQRTWFRRNLEAIHVTGYEQITNSMGI